MEIAELLLDLKKELALLKSSISNTSKIQSPISDKWVPRNEVMQFLNYGPTQMATLEHSGSLIVTKVGKRKFYLRKSVEDLLEQNILPTNGQHG